MINFYLFKKYAIVFFFYHVIDTETCLIYITISCPTFIFVFIPQIGPLWSWSYGSWIYNYNVLSPLVVSSNPAHGEVYSIQHYVIKFVIDLRQVSRFLPVLPVSSTNKTNRRDITGILLKVSLNTINPISHTNEFSVDPCRLINSLILYFESKILSNICSNR